MINGPLASTRMAFNCGYLLYKCIRMMHLPIVFGVASLVPRGQPRLISQCQSVIPNSHRKTKQCVNRSHMKGKGRHFDEIFVTAWLHRKCQCDNFLCSHGQKFRQNSKCLHFRFNGRTPICFRLLHPTVRGAWCPGAGRLHHHVAAVRLLLLQHVPSSRMADLAGSRPRHCGSVRNNCHNDNLGCHKGRHCRP